MSSLNPNAINDTRMLRAHGDVFLDPIPEDQNSDVPSQRAQTTPNSGNNAPWYQMRLTRRSSSIGEGDNRSEVRSTGGTIYDQNGTILSSGNGAAIGDVPSGEAVEGAPVAGTTGPTRAWWKNWKIVSVLLALLAAVIIGASLIATKAAGGGGGGGPVSPILSPDPATQPSGAPADVFTIAPDPTSAPNPTTQAPTISPTIFTEEDDLEAMNLLFAQISGEIPVFNDSTPQGRSRLWMLNPEEPVRIRTHGLVRVVQRFIMCTFYFALGGEDWVFEDEDGHFLTRDHECNWTGVGCRRGYVERIGLAHTNLHGAMPREVMRLLNLEAISLYNNSLTGTIPDEVWSLADLQWMDVSQNQLSGTLPSAMWTLPKNEGLFLFENKFSGQLPDVPDDVTLSPMKKLYLDVNDFTGTIPRGLSKFNATLHDLLLYNNSFTGTIHTEFTQLTLLKHFDASNNQLQGPLPDLDLPKLAKIYLSYNQISGPLPPLNLAPDSPLRVLDVYENQMTGPPPQQLPLGMRYVWLHENQFTGVLPNYGENGPLVNLSQYYACDNKLSGPIPTDWGTVFPNLEYLLLNGNNFTGSITEGLLPSGLQQFYAGNNSLFGPLPSSVPVSLVVFSAEENALSGDLTPTLTWPKMPFLTDLNLGLNNLNGVVPTSWPSMFPLLQRLQLNGNGFVGAPPLDWLAQGELELLWIQANEFSGMVDTTRLSPRMISLRIEDNLLTGDIPSEVACGGIVNVTASCVSATDAASFASSVSCSCCQCL